MLRRGIRGRRALSRKLVMGNGVPVRVRDRPARFARTLMTAERFRATSLRAA